MPGSLEVIPSGLAVMKVVSPYRGDAHSKLFHCLITRQAILRPSGESHKGGTEKSVIANFNSSFPSTSLLSPTAAARFYIPPVISI